MAKEKTIEDLKAGLMITCGALKQTNYMEPEVRSVDKVVLAFMTSVSCCALMCGMWSAQQLDNGRERLVNHLVKDWVAHLRLLCRARCVPGLSLTRCRCWT